jgi:hypothetical protein
MKFQLTTIQLLGLFLSYISAKGCLFGQKVVHVPNFHCHAIGIHGRFGFKSAAITALFYYHITKVLDRESQIY